MSAGGATVTRPSSILSPVHRKNLNITNNTNNTNIINNNNNLVMVEVDDEGAKSHSE
jgi:hypothetical protein